MVAFAIPDVALLSVPLIVKFVLIPVEIEVAPLLTVALSVVVPIDTVTTLLVAAMRFPAPA